jgi:hypothetical protein
MPRRELMHRIICSLFDHLPGEGCVSGTVRSSDFAVLRFNKRGDAERPFVPAKLLRQRKMG